MTTCKYCHAPIAWGIAAGNRRLPYDPAPVPDGPLVLVGAVIRLALASDLPGDRFQSHASSCPKTGRRRRRA